MGLYFCCLGAVCYVDVTIISLHSSTAFCVCLQKYKQLQGQVQCGTDIFIQHCICYHLMISFFNMFLTRIVEDEHRGSIRHNNGEKKRTIIQDKRNSKMHCPPNRLRCWFLFIIIFIIFFCSSSRFLYVLILWFVL